MHQPRRSVASLVGAAVIVVTSLVATVGATSPAEARTPAGKYAHRAYKATNLEREAVGLKELAKQKCVKRAAVSQAKAMAAKNQMFHQDIAPLLGSCGLGLVGENVAYGYPTGRSVVVDGWMHSAGHKANILNPAYTVVGLAARKGSDGRWYVAQVFGRPAGLPSVPRAG